MSNEQRIPMTDQQREAVAKLRVQFDEVGWTVYVDKVAEKVVLSAYGGPRAFRSLYIAPDGTVTSGVMA